MDKGAIKFISLLALGGVGLWVWHNQREGERHRAAANRYSRAAELGNRAALAHMAASAAASRGDDAEYQRQTAIARELELQSDAVWRTAA